MIKKKVFCVYLDDIDPDVDDIGYEPVEFYSKYQSLKYARKIGNGAMVIEYITEYHLDMPSFLKGKHVANGYTGRSWIYFNNRLS